MVLCKLSPAILLEWFGESRPFIYTEHLELGYYHETTNTADIAMLVCYLPHLLTCSIMTGRIQE